MGATKKLKKKCAAQNVNLNILSINYALQGRQEGSLVGGQERCLCGGPVIYGLDERCNVTIISLVSLLPLMQLNEHYYNIVETSLQGTRIFSSKIMCSANLANRVWCSSVRSVQTLVQCNPVQYISVRFGVVHFSDIQCSTFR